MNLSEVRDMIRAEASIEGLGAYTNLIDNLINQELQRLTGQAPYEELYTETPLTFTLGQFQFPLPADFQILARIIYVPYPTGNAPQAYANLFTLSKGTGYGSTTNPCGTPMYYHRSGMTLRVYPYTNAVVGDVLTLSYYKRPQLLLDSDLFPVESLVNVVQQYVMARMMAMTDSKKASMIRQNANQALIASRAENAGN